MHFEPELIKRAQTLCDDLNVMFSILHDNDLLSLDMTPNQIKKAVELGEVEYSEPFGDYLLREYAAVDRSLSKLEEILVEIQVHLNNKSEQDP